MSFATRLAATGKAPVHILEFEGDSVYGFDDSPSDAWSAGADTTNVAYQSTRVYAGAKALTLDKSGTGAVTGSASNASLSPTIDATNYPYLSVRVYLSSVANVASVAVRLGQDAANCWLWTTTKATWIGALAAGWNRLYLSMDATAYGLAAVSTVGSPTKTGIVYALVSVDMAAAGNTLTGIVWDDLRGHPHRYSSSWLPNASLLAPTVTGVLLPPVISGREHHPQFGTITSASATCKVLDSTSASTPVLDDISAINLVGRGATLKMGFRSDTEAPTNFETIHSGVVESHPHVGRAYEIGLNDMLRRLDVPFMDDATDAAPVTTTGNLVTVMLRLMLSTGNANNIGNGVGNYDSLSAARGAGISAWLVDVAAMETERDDALWLEDVEFTFTAPETSLLVWIFDQCLVHGIAPRVSNAGLFSIKKIVPPFGSDTATAIGRTDIILDGELPRTDFRLDDVYNSIRIWYDWDATTEEYGQLSAAVQDTTSITRYGLRELLLESKGITSASVAARASQRILRRLGNGAPTVECDVIMAKYAVSLGSLVSLTEARSIPDFQAGTYSMSAVYAEIAGRRFSPADKCRNRLIMRRTGFRAGNYRRIHPAGAANYDAQTAGAKAQYASISDGSQLLGAANDPTHQIGPG